MELLSIDALLEAAPWLGKYGTRFLRAVVACGISCPGDILSVDPDRLDEIGGVGHRTRAQLFEARDEYRRRQAEWGPKGGTAPVTPDSAVLDLPLIRTRYPTRLLNSLRRIGATRAADILQVAPGRFGRLVGVGEGQVNALRELQEELGAMLRGDLLVPTGSASSPEQGLAPAPRDTSEPVLDSSEWADVPLRSLWQIWDGLPATLRGSLERHRLETVGDVLGITPEQFAELRGVGGRRVAELVSLQEQLRQWNGLQDDDDSSETGEDQSLDMAVPPAVPRHRSLCELITQAVTEASAARPYAGDAQRNCAVWLARVGIGCDEPGTLEEVGQAYHITRERVRQIERTVTQRVRHLFLTDPRLVRLLENLDQVFAESLGVIGRETLGADLQARMGWERPPAGPELSALAQVLEATPHAYVQKRHDGVLWHASTCCSLWDTASALASALWGEIGEGMHVDDFAYCLSAKIQCPRDGDVPRDSKLIPCCGAANGGARLPTEYVRALLATLSPCPLTGDRVLGRWQAVLWHGTTKAHVIEAALRVIGRPAHYRELTQFICQHNPRFQPSDEGYVHCRLSSDRRCVRTGERGTYGLAEWGVERYQTAADRVEEYLMREKRPVALSALIQAMRQQGVPENNVRAVVYQLRFTRYPDGTVGLSVWDREGTQVTGDECSANANPFIDDDDDEFIVG